MRIKAVIFGLALVPAAYLVYAFIYGRLGPNPPETLQLQTGIWSFRFLLITLAVTPLRRISGWNKVIQYRRMLGLFAFFYASLHLLSYVIFDLYFDFAGLWADVTKRPFILMGMIAFGAMVPLALTSTRGWIRRLGRRWTTLHRLIYVSAIAAAIHYLWKVKVAVGSPVYYAVLVALLLAFRVFWRLFRSQPSAAKIARSPRPLPVKPKVGPEL